jgi:O-antigen/teichoic acid export membrane protein
VTSISNLLTAIRVQLHRLARSPFARSASGLAGGTAAGQLIAVAALPLLTRLYSPADFELLAVYLALLGILTSVACLRFNIAIPIPEADTDGADLLGASVLSVLLISALLTVAAVLLPATISRAMGVPRFAEYVWLIPLGVLMAGLYSALQYWSSRRQRFGEIARSRIMQAAAGVSTQIGAGFAGAGAGGLMVGHMLHGGMGAVGLAVSALRKDRAAFAGIGPSRIFARVRQYYRFPTYSTLEALSNSAGAQLPVILIAAFAFGPEAGFVFLAARVIGAPMELVGTAVSQVYLSRAPEAMRSGRLRVFTLSVIKPLALVGVPALMVLGLIAPAAFSVAFGEEWRRAGTLLQWMTPWFILQWLASPISMVLHVKGQQRTAMALQISGLILRTGIVIAAGVWATPYVAEAYAISGAIFYGAYVAVVARAILARNEDDVDLL